jgi:hypothetical protein
MKTKTYFAFRIDVWDGDGNRVVCSRRFGLIAIFSLPTTTIGQP